MPNLARTLVNLDILSQEMQDLLLEAEASREPFLVLLTQYKNGLAELGSYVSEENLTEAQFLELISKSELLKNVTSRRMLEVQIRLLEYVLDYYKATKKANEILSSDFAAQADKRLNILQSKAIKMRKQFKTVAEALGEADYSMFVELTPLPSDDWAWNKLF